MDTKNKLTLYMGIFYLIIILLFGLIIINEKKSDFIIPKIRKKLISYTEEKYNNKEFKYEKVKNKNEKYYLKVVSKLNNNLYFIVKYQDNKISDTYKKDYLEGATINKYMSKKMNNYIKKDITSSTDIYNKYEVEYNTKLNDCTNIVKEKILKEDYTLPIYTINIETKYYNFSNIKDIFLGISNYTKKLNLNPKNYNITLNNTENISKSMNLLIDNDIIVNNIDEVVIAITNNNQLLLNKYNIKLKYLN